MPVVWRRAFAAANPNPGRPCLIRMPHSFEMEELFILSRNEKRESAILAIPFHFLERETGVEPATLSLGSYLQI
jgi:hypothetical protein